MKRIFTSQISLKKGEKVALAGWVDTRRDHGKIIFIDLRDKDGIAQVVFTPQNKKLYEQAKSLRPEWVVAIEGMVQDRPKGTENAEIATGLVEISAENLTVFSEAKTLPFAINTDGYEIGEEKRLQYRYLDLRRQRLKKNLELRNNIIQAMRSFLLKEGFVEIETPILTKSTPEGARDFVVPSRLYPGSFYALPQSPQQYKQLLQVAGFEKYFQIARCFRDEDPRADRQPEFTQLDLEMSFCDTEEILNLTERLYVEIVHSLFPEKKIQQTPFPRISYKEAIGQWGSDKPDLRKNKNDASELAFAFVVDFPMFEWKKEENRWDAVHHPFTRPQTESIEEMRKNPAGVPAHQFDFVLNGYEIGGGSLRTYNSKMLEAVFEILGNKKEDIRKQFGHLLCAFEYGVPPHGGIALGIDRFVAVACGEPSIREVIAFPKTGDSKDLMMNSPAELSKTQLKELRIEITKKQ